MLSRMFAILTISMLAASTARADDSPRFSRHIVPLFSKLGCNSGVCHGAVQGKNGFRLSLFGVDPLADHAMLLKDSGARRINFVDIDASLLLQKALSRIPHEGGVRLTPGSWEHQMVRDWLVQGAPIDNVADSRVRELKVTPSRQTLSKDGDVALKIEATFADGSREDVTRFCTFSAADQDVVDVNEVGKVVARGVGVSPVIVRFGGEPVMAIITVPRTGNEPFPSIAPANFVDEHIVAQLKRLNIHPSDLCDDATFLRRASLDVTGSLPDPDEVRAFLADTDVNKRKKKIDALLNRPGYSAVWATKFSDLLKAAGFDGNFAFHEPAENRRFYEWLRARIAENAPYDQFVERILLATSREGRSQEEWIEEVIAIAEENARQTPDLPAYGQRKTLDLYWQRKEATGIKGTLQVAHAFLGLRLECAQCHRHPHDVWKQDDLLSFSNFFMRVKGAGYPDAKVLPAKAAAMMKSAPEDAKKLRAEAKKLTDKMKEKGISAEEIERCKQQSAKLEMQARALEGAAKRFGTEIRFTATGGMATVSSPLGTQKSDAYRLLGEAKAIQLDKDDDPRQPVMEWMRRPDNPYFARAIVNRIWAHYFGRGIVDPPDHLSPLNPASHPELLAALSEGFVKSGYDLKWVHRTILASRTYQTNYRTNETNKTDRRNFASFHVRRLPAEVLVDTVNHATAGREIYPSRLFLPEGTKAIEVAGAVRVESDTASLAYAFQAFGRPVRNSQIQCDCERENMPTVVQTLYLANHPQVRSKITAAKSRIVQLIEQHADNGRRVEELYLWTLGRTPSADERDRCVQYIRESPSALSGIQDVQWSLINTREFLLNY